jgi:hypothetical protein
MFGEKLSIVLLGSTAWGILFLGNVLGLFPLFDRTPIFENEFRNRDNGVHDASN